LVQKDFIAEFYEVKGSALWQQYSCKIPFKHLEERKKDEKPSNTFRKKSGSYLFNEAAIEEYTPKGLSILKYVIGKSEPFTFYALKSGQSIRDICKTNAYLLDIAISRGEVKNVIAGSMKSLEHKFEFITFGFGVGVGAMAIWLLFSLHVLH